MQRQEIVPVKIADDVLNGLNGRQRILLVVRFPLVDMQLFLGSIGILGQFAPHVVEAFKCSDTCGSYGNYLCVMFYYTFKHLALNADVLGVHVVVAYLFRLNRLEGACTHMKGDLLALHIIVVERSKHILAEVQACRWRRHTTLYLAINSLVCGLVTFFCLAVKVWRNRQFAHRLKQLAKREVLIVPCKAYVLVL